MQIITVGCGVSGLSSAIKLVEGGHEVAIWARELPPRTTSNIAAAFWYPYHAFPEDKVLAWGQRTFEVLCGLVELPGSGVSLVSGLEFYKEATPDPNWKATVHHFRHLHAHELPAGYSDGFAYEVPLIEMSIYLDYLMQRFQKAGGKIVERSVSSLTEPLAESDLVVNCSGLGAGRLVDDPAVFPIRGQIVRIAPPPAPHVILSQDDETNLTYIVNRSKDCILGGTAQVDNWSTEPDATTARQIIERSTRLLPQISESQVVEHLVGLRPGRDAVRLEAELQPGGQMVIHNYGHGGAGVTLSWGCAEEVAHLVAVS